MMKLVRESRTAPSPGRGNARRVWELLDEMGDWTKVTDIVHLVEDIKNSSTVSHQTQVKQALSYMAGAGYLVWQKTGRGREYKLAPYAHFEKTQKKLDETNTSKHHEFKEKPEEEDEQPILKLKARRKPVFEPRLDLDIITYVVLFNITVGTMAAIYWLLFT